MANVATTVIRPMQSAAIQTLSREVLQHFYHQKISPLVRFIAIHIVDLIINEDELHGRQILITVINMFAIRHRIIKVDD